MKLLFVITGLGAGGAEAMLLKLLENLDPRFSPHVVSLTTLGEIGPRIQRLGIPVEALGMRPPIPSPAAFSRLVRLIRHHKPDIVHTWLYHADLFGGLAARAAQVPAVSWCLRNGSIDQTKTRLTTRIVLRVCAVLSHWVPDKILSCSENARLVHIDYGFAADKIVVIPNGFDIRRFRPDPVAREAIRSELGIEANALLVGLIGRFDPQKNHAAFLEAARTLHRRQPSVRFVLAGKGVDANNSSLMRQIEVVGLTGAVHLLGLRNDVPRVMAALDVLALSSAYGEAFPNVLGEAMACGIPCVATDVGDSAYIIGDTGVVVSVGNSAGFSAAMESLVTMSASDRSTLGEKARTRVGDIFDIAHITRRYERFYDDLAASNGPSIPNH